eukprot:scaffold22225_cov72-Phaeocystis_antarctica.AAC.1
MIREAEEKDISETRDGSERRPPRPLVSWHAAAVRPRLATPGRQPKYGIRKSQRERHYLALG